MFKVIFSDDLTLPFRKSSESHLAVCEAGRNYILSANMLNTLRSNEAVARKLHKVSSLDNTLENFNVHAPKKPGRNKLLFYNGSGGYGDAIMSWPVTVILTKLGYEVSVLSDPGNQMCWYRMPWIKNVLVLPLIENAFKDFDHYVLFNAVANNYEHSDSKHPLDTILNKIGVPSDSIPPEDKIVRPVFTENEMREAAPFNGRKLAIYQLYASDPTRSLPISDSLFILTKLAEEFQDHLFIAPYDQSKADEVTKLLLEDDIGPDGQPKKAENGSVVKKLKYANIVPKFFPRLRGLWALTSQSKFVVSPDSMMVHVAGVLGIPCVGMWGTFDPISRAKYYKNHVPVYHKNVCRSSPCCVYSGKFPSYCPPRKDRNVCECLAAISPQDIIDAIHKSTSTVKSA